MSCAWIECKLSFSFSLHDWPMRPSRVSFCVSFCIWHSLNPPSPFVAFTLAWELTAFVIFCFSCLQITLLCSQCYSDISCYIHPLARDNWPHIKYRVVGSLLLDARWGWFNLILSTCRDTRSDENATICVHCSLLALLPLGHGLIINLVRLASVSTTPKCSGQSIQSKFSYTNWVCSFIHKEWH